MQKYVDFSVEMAKKLLACDSPTGFTKEVALLAKKEFEELGFAAEITKKGGVLVDLGGEDEANALLLEAHIDTLGAMVAEIKANGRLRLTPLGGMDPCNAEAENCRIYTRAQEVYDGSFQLNNASIHVNDDYSEKKRAYDEMEVVIDEKVTTKEETKQLGIMVGDIVAFHPRTTITSSGYIKSRFLDDKLSAGIFFGLAKYIKEQGIVLPRKVYMHLTVYEEVGHGACGTVPEGVTEILSVDMGCVGDGLTCTEHQVSICAKDSAGPYTYEVVSDLIAIAKENEIDFAVDVYPHYGSDADAALKAGYDVRHGLIGPGVYASHGYERSHIDGVKQTFALLVHYLKKES